MYIDEENQGIIDRFKIEFLRLKSQKQLLNNIPNKEAEVSQSGHNKTAGIISELFFYTNYSKDIFMDKNYSDSTTEYRGYDKLLTASKEGITKMKSYFLAPQYHARIEENMDDIERCLNNNSLQIEYRFLKYDYDQIKPFVEELKKRNRKNSEVI